jgi:starch-binding outer membrane protein, SusD/RagB family
MKKYLLYIIAAVMCCTTACDDFLTPEPSDKYPETVGFSSEENTKLYVNTFYPVLSHYGLFGGAYLSGNMYVDGLTDIEKCAGSTIGSNGAVANMYATTPSLITSDQNSLDIWTNAYYNIRLINEFLDGIDKNATYAESIKTRFKAEARFFRGYLYFLLMRNHGSVILLTELTSDPIHSRSEASDCWDFIESEFDFAAANLPEAWPIADAGRVTKGAAFAMKSRAMLYAERWQSAFNAADSVLAMVTDGTYKLADNYADAFGSYSNDGNKEAILEYNYSYPQLTHSFDYIASPGGDNTGYGGDIQPTQELVESYEKAGGGIVDWSEWHANGVTTTPPWATLEPRFQATVLYNGSTWKGRTIETYDGGTDGWVAYPPVVGSNKGASVTGYYLKKYVDETHTDLVNRASSQPMVEIRLAEVYLNYAEAAYKLTKTAEANFGLDKVRGRVGLNTGLNLTGTALFAQIKKERKIELACEGQRYWDLRRWKDAETVLTGLYVHGLKPVFDGSTFTYDYITCDDLPRQFPEKFYAFPILSSERSNNPACLQIPGW